MYGFYSVGNKRSSDQLAYMCVLAHLYIFNQNLQAYDY